MSPERWGQVKDIFHEALDRAPSERGPFLDSACPSGEIRSEVESLLAAHEGADAFIEDPAFTVDAERLADEPAMGSMAGRSLGHYDIERLVGSGGMGEVYRARDRRLGRTVALKMISPHASGRLDLRRRLEREARALSHLSHPHICTLYDAGSEGEIDYLVMEYLDGEPLGAALRRGPLPAEQALRYAAEIASALDEAHRRGVIHRDLKPSNIMLTPGGAKLLDFGLAKPFHSPILSTAGDAPTESQRLTIPGSLLGTVQYMAPEQFAGLEADARSDIFSFGAVFYEMLTGRKAFDAPSQMGLIAAITEGRPEPLTGMQADLQHLLDRCLAKRPEDRCQSARDVLDIVEQLQRRPAPGRAGTGIAWAAAAILAAIAVAAAWRFFDATPTGGPRIVAQLPAPETSVRVFTSQNRGSLVVSPDGLRVAFVARSSNDENYMWVRALDSVAPHLLEGTADAAFPFWSPDSQSLGFFAHGRLKRISRAGGPVRELAPAVSGRGGSWGRDGAILYAPAVHAGIFRVPENGGPALEVTRLDATRSENSHRWPQLLPDGRHFFYYANASSSDNSGTYLASWDGGPATLLLHEDSAAVFAQPNYLLFVRSGALLARAFYPQSLRLSPDVLTVAESVAVNLPVQRANFSVSEHGLLAYQGGSPEQGGTQLRWVQQDGGRGVPLGAASLQLSPRLSPDGSRIAVSAFDAKSGNEDIWVVDAASGHRTRITFDMANDWGPVWSPDGTRLVYASNRRGRCHLYQRLATGLSTEQPLAVLDGEAWPVSWHPSGRFIAYHHRAAEPDARWGIWALPLHGEREPFPLNAGAADARSPAFSPDGRSIAYQSRESGREEIYLADFPDLRRKAKVSAGGGSQPLWRRDGRELYYLSEGKLMAAAIAADTVRAIKTLFPVTAPNVPGFVYDAAPDGSRFLILSMDEDAKADPIHLVLNWTEGMKR